MATQVCPRCDYTRRPLDGAVHPGICPGCGIAIAKWLARQQGEKSRSDESGCVLARSDTGIRAHGCAARLLEVPERSDRLAVYGRGALWAGLFIWGAWFVVHGIDWEVIGGSFMHQINLPFHEFGHVLFAPFGRFLAILGGSLFQVSLPLGLAVAFVISQRDNFGASICLWWCGQSFVDLAPYIADAPLRALPLVGGAGESSHDWGNLLEMLGWMDGAQGLARLSFAWGSLLMGVALGWGLLLLRTQVAGLSRVSGDSA